MNEALRGRVRWVLLVSLALNIALALALALPRLGIVGGSRGGWDGNRLPGPWVLRSALSEERRAEIRPMLEPHRAPIRAAIRDARQARRDLDMLLRAEEVDAATLDATLAELRRRDGVTIEVVHRMLAEAILQMEPGEREKLADRLSRRDGDRDRGRDSDRGRDGDREPRPAPDSAAAPGG